MPRFASLAGRVVRGVLVVGLASSLFAAGALWGSHRAEEPPSAAPVRDPDVLRFDAGAPQLAMLRVSAVPSLPVPLAEPLNARIAYDENHTGRVSSPVPGRVVELRKLPGDRVAAGEALAVIDAPELGTALADAAKARADEHRRSLALGRARDLYAGEVLPRKDLEAAEADFAQARAESARAAMRVENLDPRRARISGQRLLLLAPVGGVVVERRANPGLEVRPDLADPLFVVTDPATLQAVIDLPESVLERVAPGQPVTVEVDAYPGRRFAGRLERIAPAMDPALRRVQARASIDAGGARLMPEMYARVSIHPGEARSTVRVPNGALVTQGVQHFVFVERAPGVLARRRVELLLQDREYCWLASGVEAGERVVTTGALLLQSELASAP